LTSAGWLAQPATSAMTSSDTTVDGNRSMVRSPVVLFLIAGLAW
jgi:hypothetical protein